MLLKQTVFTICETVKHVRRRVFEKLELSLDSHFPLIELLRLEIHWRLLTILKTSKKAYGVMFFDSLFNWYTIQEMHYFFLFCELQLIAVIFLIHDSYMCYNTKFFSRKEGVEFVIFNSVTFFFNFIFLINIEHELFDFKTS